MAVVRADMQRRAAPERQSRQQGQSRSGNQASTSNNGGLTRSAIKASTKEQWRVEEELQKAKHTTKMLVMVTPSQANLEI